MSKVYLETSFFSACVSTRSTVISRGWHATSRLWWESQSSQHDLFISPEVVSELSSPGFRNRVKALEMIRGLKVLDLTDDVLRFAEILVQEKVMPEPSVSGDAIHLAVATLNHMDYILSWNVKHLANDNKRAHLGVICMRLRLVAPLVVTPDSL